MSRETNAVWICSACGEAACAAGELLCEDYRSASMVKVIEVTPYSGPFPGHQGSYS